MGEFSNSARPLVSCGILLTANDLFVKAAARAHYQK
jgi:hypothetical protein